MLSRARRAVKLTIEIAQLNNEIRFQLQKGWRLLAASGGGRACVYRKFRRAPGGRLDGSV
jgi:hypothetical protein